MKATIPANLDVHKHIAENPVDEYGFKRFNIDHMLYILDLVTSIPARNKDIADGMIFNGGYTPMYSNLLQSNVPDYKKYLQYSLDTGVLLTDGKYCQMRYSKEGKAKSLGYKYTDKYQIGELVALDYSPYFETILKRRKLKKFKKIKLNYGHLTKWLSPTFQLAIDTQKAYEFIEIKKLAQIKNPALQDDKKDSFSGQTVKKSPLAQYLHSMYNINYIERGYVYCTIDDKVNRMHTNLTNLNSELRNLLTCNGETLYSIDIVSSQPYLTLALFNNKLPEIIKHSPVLASLLTLVKSAWNNIENKDFKEFASLVSDDPINKDDFYDYIQERMDKSKIGTLTRSQIKAGIFEVLFSRNGHKTAAKAKFTELFPTVDALYRSLKEQKHANLSCLLQSIESFVVLQIITKKVAKHFPKAPLFTIHDSIATTAPYVENVRQIMITELTKLTKYPPKLKIDAWVPEQVEKEKLRYQII